MSTRRNVLALGILILLILFSKTGEASEQCTNSPTGMRTCVAGIKSEKLTHVTAIQKLSQWCWAASISMVFSYHGHPVAQEAIVKDTYGSVVNMPAISGDVISNALNRNWRDSKGVRFRSRATVFDFQSGSYGVSNDDIVRELKNDRPLIMGAMGHAMVVTAMQYVKSPDGRVGQVLGVTVRDPWPGKGRRQLTLQELQPIYVATVQISNAQDDTEVAEGDKDGCQSDSDCHAGRMCEEGRCTAGQSECSKDSDCDDDEFCEDHRCVSDEDDESGEEDEIAHWCCTHYGKFGPYTPNDVRVGQSCQWPTPGGIVYGVACN